MNYRADKVDHFGRNDLGYDENNDGQPLHLLCCPECVKKNLALNYPLLLQSIYKILNLKFKLKRILI